MFVELDTRHSDGLTVTLEWDRDSGQTQIVLHDARSDGLIAFGVPPVSAADALALTPPSLLTGSGIHCDAVRAAYRVWFAASAFAEPLAFEAYQSALDREERAAKTYAGLMRRVRHLTETGLAHRLALIQAPHRGVLER